MPGAGGRFQPTVRTNGMARLPDARGNEAWKGSNTDVRESIRGKQNRLANMNRQGFNATNVSTNSRFGKGTPSEVSEDMHRDSSSETEILDAQYRHKGIKMEKTFVVESTKGIV